jgi:hypothetical protein
VTPKQLPVDKLALEFGNDMVDYIRNWMRGNHAEDIDFHRYKMRLLTSLSDVESVSEKIMILAAKSSREVKFSISEYVRDKLMGEAIARYIFGKIMIRLNEEYKKILELEADKTSAEIHTLSNRLSGLKNKIGQH